VDCLAKAGIAIDADVRADSARMQAVCRGGSTSKPSRQFAGEPNVRQLRLRVTAPSREPFGQVRVGEVDPTALVRAGRYVHDPPLRGAKDCIKEKVGQQKVAEMVNAHHGLEAVCCRLPLHREDAGVVHEHIENAVLLEKRLGENADARKRTEVAQHKLDTRRAALLASLCQRHLASLTAAAQHNDVSALFRQRHSGCQPHPGVGTGHERDFILHINPPLKVFVSIIADGGLLRIVSLPEFGSLTSITHLPIESAVDIRRNGDLAIKSLQCSLRFYSCYALLYIVFLYQLYFVIYPQIERDPQQGLWILILYILKGVEF
jgi:hypothetical protein